MATGPSIERHIQKAGKRLSKGLEDVSYVPVTGRQLADRHIVTFMVVPFASVRCLRLLLYLIYSTTASSIVRSNSREQLDEIHTSGEGG